MSSNSATPRAIAWDLLENHDHKPPAVSVPFYPYGKHGESAFPDDSRTLVPKDDFQEGGKYRSIVKLQMRFENQTADDLRWAMGTGWLIRPDLLVTAGHCAFDWANNFGRAIAVKAYVGYNGQASVEDPAAGVQFRRGTRIVASPVWVAADGNEMSDVSFIKLESSFDNVSPFNWAETPSNGQESLTIVGYPADKRMDNQQDGEQGAQMWVMSRSITYDLNGSGNAMHLLQYSISTYAGNSGSPVLRTDTNTSIGTHVLGGEYINSASVIGGKYGNPYYGFTKVADIDIGALPDTASHYKLVTIPANSQIEFDLLNVFKPIIKVAGPILSGISPVASVVPVIGPIAGPLTAILGGAMETIGKNLGESAFGDGEVTPQLDQPGAKELALLHEAALQTVLKLDAESMQESGILSTMKSVYNTYAPKVTAVGAKLLPLMLEPALRLALDELHKRNQGETGLSSPKRQALPLPKSGNESSLPDKVNGFVNSLLQPTLVKSSPEFWNELPTIITCGCATPSYLQYLGPLAAKSGTENALDESSMDGLLEVIKKRAVLGQAAYQALLTAPPKYLQDNNVADHMKEVLQRIGPVVMTVAPCVKPGIASILASARKSVSSESSMAPNGPMPPKQTLGELINAAPIKNTTFTSYGSTANGVGKGTNGVPKLTSGSAPAMNGSSYDNGDSYSDSGRKKGINTLAEALAVPRSDNQDALYFSSPR